MRHATFRMTSVCFAVICLSGCLRFETGGSTEDCSVSLYDPMFSELPDRFAFGTSYTAGIIGATGVATAESSNPEVVRLQRIDDEHAELSFMGKEPPQSPYRRRGLDRAHRRGCAARAFRRAPGRLGAIPTAVVPVGGPQRKVARRRRRAVLRRRLFGRQGRSCRRGSRRCHITRGGHALRADRRRAARLVLRAPRRARSSPNRLRRRRRNVCCAAG